MKNTLLIITFIITGLISTTTTLLAEVNVNPPETFSLGVCDDNGDGIAIFDLTDSEPIILDGQNPNDFVFVYYLTSTDANAETNPIINPESYTNTITHEEIYARFVNVNSGEFLIRLFYLDVYDNPLAITPTPLEYCDPDNDGFGEFMLTDKDVEITGGDQNLVVTYHYLLEDAVNGVLPLPSPYFNIVPFLHMIYVRLLDQSTGCYSITTLDLWVLESPQIIEPSGLMLCDEDGDGIAIFDLTQGEEELLNGLNPALYTITYYEDISLINAIANPTAYANIPPSPQMIFIVVEDIANECQSQTTLLLWTNIPPELTSPLPLEACDVTEITGPDDELEPFDLESKTDEITGGDVNIIITYHETQADANMGDNPLVSPYINITNPKTIYIRAEDVTTNCITSQGTTLDLVVLTLPSPITPTPLEVCDEDGDGYAEFILSYKVDEIIGGEPGVTISFHQTQLDADLGVNPLIDPYTNIETPSQIIYVRAEFETPGSGCYRLVPLELIVHTVPETVTVSDYIIFDENNDGIEVFDLTTKIPEILDGQTDVVVTFYETQQDAIDNVNAITNPETYQNSSNPQTIFTRLENVESCYGVGNFEIFADPDLGITQNLFEDLTIYPNPTKGILNISSNGLIIENIAIINLQGIILKNTSNKNEIDVSNLATGIYFIQLSVEGKTITKKFIKN